MAIGILQAQTLMFPQHSPSSDPYVQDSVNRSCAPARSLLSYQQLEWTCKTFKFCKSELVGAFKLTPEGSSGTFSNGVVPSSLVSIVSDDQLSYYLHCIIFCVKKIGMEAYGQSRQQ
jgi:hypothetical protein